MLGSVGRVWYGLPHLILTTGLGYISDAETEAQEAMMRGPGKAVSCGARPPGVGGWGASAADPLETPLYLEFHGQSGLSPTLPTHTPPLPGPMLDSSYPTLLSLQLCGKLGV